MQEEERVMMMGTNNRNKKKKKLLLLNNGEEEEEEEESIEMKSLKWVCADQSSMWKAAVSWSVFLLMSVGVPIVTHFFLLCSSCDSNHQRPYDAVVQLSLSVFSSISFYKLSSWSRKFGLHRFLFLDKIAHETPRIQLGYKHQLHRSMLLLCIFVMPCFALESIYRIWWYATGVDEIPYFWNMYVSDTVACIMQLCSWVYRLSIFILVCIIYRLICYLQILKLEDFAQVFQKESDVSSILKEHLRLRRNLRIISHRFRSFILMTLVLVTVCQFVFVLTTMRSSATNNIFEAGELALCSINLVTGLFICLRSATKITHKAQSITSLAAKWHVCATIDSYDMDGETPSSQIVANRLFEGGIDWLLEDEEEEDGDDLDNTKIMPMFANTISFQKRQALVTYLENNKAGMTVYGFSMDRAWLHTIFGVELALLLWLLNKTIVNWS